MKEKLTEIRKSMDAALKQVANETGTSLKIGNIAYSENNFRIKIEGIFGGELSREAEAYDLNREILGLPERGTEIFLNGKQFRTTGYKSRARKNDIIIESDPGGKKYVVPNTLVKDAIESQKQAEAVSSILEVMKNKQEQSR